MSLVSSAFVYFIGGQQMFVRSVAYSVPSVLLIAWASLSYLKVPLKGFSILMKDRFNCIGSPFLAVPGFLKWLSASPSQMESGPWLCSSTVVLRTEDGEQRMAQKGFSAYFGPQHNTVT